MSASNPPIFASDLQGSANACLVRLKVVPGSRRDQIVGQYGDRLKVKVSAPPEDGRANQAVCELLAKRLDIAVRSVSIVNGLTNPEKIAKIEGLTAGDVHAQLS